MDNSKTFEEICYDFQKKIIEIFNNEKDIPFLLKYYLLKEIWQDIQTYKLKLNQEFITKNTDKESQEKNEEI